MTYGLLTMSSFINIVHVNTLTRHSLFGQIHAYTLKSV